MPPVFKPPVAVERALMVLGSGKQLRRLAVAKRVQRNLHAFQKFLDHNVGAGRAEGLADQDLINGPFGLRLAGANQNAFAERQAIGLNRTTPPKTGKGSWPPSRRRKRPGPRRRNAVFLHEILGKNFGRLELRGFLVRPPDAQAVFLE